MILCHLGAQEVLVDLALLQAFLKKSKEENFLVSVGVVFLVP
jgi:hypothetical protein